MDPDVIKKLIVDTTTWAGKHYNDFKIRLRWLRYIFFAIWMAGSEK